MMLPGREEQDAVKKVWETSFSEAWVLFSVSPHLLLFLYEH